MTENIPGLPRKYFYQRLANDLDELLWQRQQQEMTAWQWSGEETQNEMVMKVNVQDALNRLKTCPVCGAEFHIYPDYPLERSCPNQCGDFTITDVWSDGDVAFQFKMVAPEKLEAGPPPDGE